MTVIIPMAWENKRFKHAGFLLDKPFILVNQRPMIETVVNNLNLKDEHHIFIVRKEQYEKYGLSDYLPSLVKSCDIVQLDNPTEGAACAVALAEPYVKDERIVVANSDQYIDKDLKYFFDFAKNKDGLILTFSSKNPDLSYIQTMDIDNAYPEEYITRCSKVIMVAAKRVISNTAAVGIYTWKTPSLLFDSIRQMIKENFRVNNEFYLCPSYQYILDKEIWDYRINKFAIFGLGTPEDLENYVKVTE